MDNKIKRIPIARCPNPDCSRTLLFSCDPKDKLHVTTKIADESYQGKTMICSRCKTTVAIIEKPKVAQGQQDLKRLYSISHICGACQ